MDDTIRVAVCQLECHPAIIVGDRDFTREPLVPGNRDPSLADISRYALDVSSLQTDCSDKYFPWHTTRLQAVLEHLKSYDPVPDVVVFPECSIPVHDLYSLRAFAVEHECVVFAGTHTLRQIDEDKQHYDALEIGRKSRKSWKKLTGMTVLPIFCGTEALAHPKVVPSVFEHIDVSEPRKGLHTICPLSLTFRKRTLRILPAVCAEIVNLNAAHGTYDMAVIVAYNEGIAPFLPTIRQNTQNQIPVVFCNDGRYGHSSINVVMDHRMSGFWWWNAPIEGLLPPGDAILVADVHLDHLAVEFGVTNPSPPAHLVALTPLVAEYDVGDEYRVAREMLSIAGRHDNALQASLIEGCLQEYRATPLQEIILLQLKRLATAGSASAEWWRRIGHSCFLNAQHNLHGLETELCTAAVNLADKLLTSSTIENDALLGKIARFKRACSDRARPHALPDTDLDDQRSDAFVGREDETRQIRAFLDHVHQRVMFVSGLDDVGKRTAINAAMAQAGHRTPAIIDLAPDATLGFIANALAKHFKLPTQGISTDETIRTLKDVELTERIPFGSTIILSHAENLIEHGQLRDARTPTVLGLLVAALQARKSKLIIVSAHRLELPDIEPRFVSRLWMRGLSDLYGVLLLDQRLRQMGLDPSNYQAEQKKDVVRDVGGHPGAIILVADYVEQTSFDEVKQDLSRRKGMHTKIVRRILKRLTFTENQLNALSLLSLARIPLPADVFRQAGIPDAMATVHSLVYQCVVERHKNDYVALSDLVRGFADFPGVHTTTETLFHKAAAEALCKMAETVESAEELRWAIESRFHAHLAGDTNLAPNVAYLVDGSLGALQSLVDRHDYESAKPLVDELLKAVTTGEVFQLAAIVYARLGKTEEALALAKEAISAEPTRTWIVTEVGRLALHVRRTDIANECVELVRRTGHDNPFLATLQGQVLLREEGDSAAVTAFRRGVELSEVEGRRDAWPHFYYGRCLIKLGKTEEAIEVLFQGEELLSTRRRPSRKLVIAIRTQLAIAYVLNSNLPQAKMIFDLITGDNAGNPEVVRAFALYRVAAGDAANVHELAQQTLRELDPAQARDRYGRCQACLFRALIYLGMDNPERASVEFASAHREDPRNVFVLLRWASTLIDLATESEREGEHQAARICAEQAKSLADKVLEFDVANADALQILEKLSDDFNVL